MSGPPIPLIFGPMLIGVFFNTILYGILVMQTFVYLQVYKKDPLWIRLFIIFLFIAETVNTILNILTVYEPLILRYGTLDAVTFFPTLLTADPILTVIISTPVQLFIGWRIRIISKSVCLSAIIGLLAITAFGGGIWLGVTVKTIERFSRKPELHIPALLWLLSSAVVDIVITFSLVYHLAQRRTGFTGTDTIINKIIRMTIQTGMITAFFATVDVICFQLFPHTTINFIWDFALCKLYTNALLSTLNARTGWDTLANGRGHNILMFPMSEGHGSRNNEIPTFGSVDFHFQVPRLMTSTTGYEMDSPSEDLAAKVPCVTATTFSSSSTPNADLEFGGVSVKREVSMKMDPSPDFRLAPSIRDAGAAAGSKATF